MPLALIAPTLRAGSIKLINNNIASKLYFIAQSSLSNNLKALPKTNKAKLGSEFT